MFYRLIVKNQFCHWSLFYIKEVLAYLSSPHIHRTVLVHQIVSNTNKNDLFCSKETIPSAIQCEVPCKVTIVYKKYNLINKEGYLKIMKNIKD